MAVEAHAFEQRRRRVHGTLTASCIDAAPANEGPKSGLVPVVRRGSVRLVSLLLSASAWPAGGMRLMRSFVSMRSSRLGPFFRWQGDFDAKPEIKLLCMYFYHDFYI